MFILDGYAVIVRSNEWRPELSQKECLMNHKCKSFVLIGIFLLTGVWLGAGVEEGNDKTLSPYFVIRGVESSVDGFPLKSTAADVSITGVIADVRVTQVYQNLGSKPLEAVYIFPASTRAAVYGMRMTIGERTVEAVVRRREKARQEYENALKEGKTASLLEQQRPNVFQMNVGNILPGDVVKVELQYTELLIPTEGTYEFVYPVVVGPRYSEIKASDAVSQQKWVANPYLHQGESPTYTFNLDVQLAAGMPIRDVACPSHEVEIEYRNPEQASIQLSESEGSGGNRDFILQYRLTGGEIQSGLLLFKGKEENFFLLMMQPPQQVRPERIPPREFIFVVDVSGSMHGFPLDVSNALMRRLLNRLRPSDRFNILLFAGGSRFLSEKSLPATSENIQAAVHFMEAQRGGGGTRLLPALRSALRIPRDEECSCSIVVITDGYIHVERETFDLIRNNLGDANLFAFGIGSSVNRYLIEGMARMGMGEPFVVTDIQSAKPIADRFIRYIQRPVLTRVDVDFGDFDVFDVEPAHLPDVLAERPVVVFGKWTGRPEGNIRLQGLSGDLDYSSFLDVSKVVPLESHAALRYLWARHRIALLSDFNRVGTDDDLKEEITQLGLKYNLLTAFTSFVAIYDVIRNTKGKTEKVRQPLPLPQGVSDLAVGGGSIGSTPEPETWMLLIVAVLVLGWIILRKAW